MNDGRRRRTARCAGIAAGALALSPLLVACTAPGERVRDEAAAFGFERAIVTGLDYRHVVYFNHRAEPKRILRVYLEGDGSPYLDRWTVAADPTPRRPVMLRLMALDDLSAVYVGRPCYDGLAQDPPCTAVDWTVGRYGPRVVASLQQVIEQLARERAAEEVELYGHSGGGTLAVLLAARVRGVRRVVTVSANLDTEAWTELHGYSPLGTSLNPAELGPLPPSVGQRHYAGGKDRVVPASLVDAGARRLGGAGAIVIPAAGHVAGWPDYWPAIVAGQCPSKEGCVSGTTSARRP
ncbi:MAG: alpha/beta hydrolase [Lysobacterales bacterium]|nr:MAG: alpha/beta hydrolase [Xanthomonadales bacterium]